MEIYTHPRFDKQYKKLPKKVKLKAKEKEKIFRDNPFDVSLKTHTLHGKERELWSFWIDYHYRIKFSFITEQSVLFLEVGLHSIYK